MKTHPSLWARLVTIADQCSVSDTRDAQAPAAFATRVVAIAFADEPTFVALFSRYAPRALGVFGLVMVLCVTVGLSSALNTFEADTSALSDPVTEWFDAAS